MHFVAWGRLHCPVISFSLQGFRNVHSSFGIPGQNSWQRFLKDDSESSSNISVRTFSDSFRFLSLKQDASKSVSSSIIRGEHDTVSIKAEAVGWFILGHKWDLWDWWEGAHTAWNGVRTKRHAQFGRMLRKICTIFKQLVSWKKKIIISCNLFHNTTTCNTHQYVGEPSVLHCGLMDTF